MSLYTVYVGGLEVNDHYLTKAEAVKVAGKYPSYDDVEIVRVRAKGAYVMQIDERNRSKLDTTVPPYSNIWEVTE